MTSQSFSQASAYASQFLHNSFAPFHSHSGQDPSGPSSASAHHAPLFYSTLDNGSVGLLDEEVGTLLHRSSPPGGEGSQRRYSRSARVDQRRQGQRGVIDEGDEEEEEEDEDTGLGRYNSDYEDNASASTSDPFKVVAAGRSDDSSRPVTPHQLQPGPPGIGWRMYGNQLKVSQAALNDIYERASGSVYSSVFVSNHDKGKGRALELDSNILEEAVKEENDDKGPPPELLTGGPGGSTPVSRPSSRLSVVDHFATTYAASSSTQQRYPMPVSRYRYNQNVSSASLQDWQDQSPRDPFWRSLYLANLGFTIALSLYLLLFVPADPRLDIGNNLVISPSLHLLSSLPLLFTLSTLSSLAAATLLAGLLLLRSLEKARLVLQATLLLPPVLTLSGAAWAFSSSYSHFSSTSSDSAEISYSRLILRYSAVAILLSVFLNMRWYYKSSKARLERTIRVVQVAAEVLLVHPSLFTLALALLGAFLTATFPFILICAKLLTSSGHFEAIGASAGNASAWFPSTPVMALTCHTAFVYFWSLAVFRALLKHTIAGTVAEWWYHRHSAPSTYSLADLSGSKSSSTYGPKRAARTVTSAFVRARTLSLGTVCLAALLQSLLHAFDFILRMSSAALLHCRRFSSSTGLPGLAVRLFTSIVLLPLVAVLGRVLQTVNAFALTHAAVSGEPFWAAAKEAKDLITGRQGTDVVASHLMLYTLLNLLSIAAALLGSIAGYLSMTAAVASSSAIAEEEGVVSLQLWSTALVAVLCGLVPYWTIRFAGDILANTVDAIFVCFNIDLDTGRTNCQKAFDAFAYEEKEEDADDEGDELEQEQSVV